VSAGAGRHDAELLRLVAALQADAALQPAGDGGDETSPHPEPGHLLDYRRGELTQAETAAVQEHLVVCRACAAVLVDLDELEGEGAAALEDDDEEDDDPSRSTTADFAAARAWRELTARLPDEDAALSTTAPRDAAPRDAALRDAAPSTTAPGSAHRPRPAAVWLPWAAAATLAVVALGLAFQVARLDRRTGELTARLERSAAPQADVPVIYLDSLTRDDPGSDAAANGGLDAAVPPPAGGVAVLVLAVEDPARYPVYQLEVEDAAGTVVTIDGLHPAQPYGTLRAALPRAAFGDDGPAGGPLTVRVYGVDGEERRELASYRVRLGA
jgi:hypothetical protein